ncbi:uncharacterized protein LOC108245979 isoform X2 [Kryptolebias marmoratus]|uniref:uncharacterized protein LOC108245979 isoform X2 n=1 Tax=Kryptolebias marmoratus TaxID=37003 RepID=UPI0018ACD2CE|nr:uncharacterized protein LOC108245979 isoform X2 [Kryptolebias marmoratus]
MQSLPLEPAEPCPVSTSTPEKLPDAEAQPDAQEKEDESNTAAETTAGQSGAQAAEAPSNMAVTEAGVLSESRDNKSDPTEPVPGPKANPGRNGHKVKKPDKGVGNVRKYIPSKRAMMDPLKMDMSKPIVMPLTSAELSLQCMDCHIIFSDHKSKQRHLKLSHPAEYEQCILRNSLFACYVCDRHFTNSTELMAHQKAHTEKKPFKCPLCVQAFKKSSELTAHKKTHFGEHGYACNDCGKPYKTMTLLKYHHRSHTGDKPYICKECGKRFNMSKALQRHMESHLPEGAEGHEANPTDKPKQNKNDGNSPMKYPCSVCKATFKTPKTRQYHMKTKHKLAAASVAPLSGPQSKQSSPIITPISVSQPSLLQLEPHGPLQRVDANIDTEQIRKLIESLGNVQKVNQVVILGQVPPNAPPLELQQVSEPTELVNMNLSPPQLDFIGLKQAESKTAELDPSIDPMEQTIILEPITPDGQLENPSFSDLGSHVASGGHIELTLIGPEQTERHGGDVMHQIFQQPEDVATPMVCQNELDELKENLEQTVILELTPALMPAMELDQTQSETLNEVASSSLVLNTDQEAPDQTAINEQKDSLPSPPPVPTEQQDLCSSSFAPSDTQPPSKSKEDSEMENVGLDQVPEVDKKTCDQAKQDPIEELPAEGKNTPSEVPSAKDETNSQLQTTQTSEFSVNVMSAQELVKVRKRKPARTFFFQGYMHDLLDFQFDAKPAKRQKTKKSHLVVKFGSQNKDKKSKKQKKQTQQHQPVREEPMKSRSPAKKLSEKKVQTPKKTGKGKKQKSGGNALSGGDVKLPSTQTPQVQQAKKDASKKKMKKQKVAHSSEHKSAASPVFKKKKQAKVLQKDQPKGAKTEKAKEKPTKEQAEKAEEAGSHINQDALLLLKGHKQPQLKVYKLDPSKAPGQTPETSPHDSRTVSHTSKSADSFTADGKKKGGRAKKNQKALSLLSALKVSHPPPETAPAKPRTPRKRKAPSNVETEGVITSKHALECKNCGEKFNEVSSFQKHKMSAHVVESPRLMYTNGNIFEGVSGSDLFQRPKKNSKIVRVMKSPMDWDTEPETALEDRERSVSFPALIPSPSLPIPPQDAEMSTYEDQDGSKTVADKQSYPSLDVQSPCNEIKSREADLSVTSESSFFTSTPTQSSEMGEPLVSGEEDEEATKDPKAEPEGQGNTEEDFKEDLLLEVDLVTVGEQSERDDPVTRADSIDQNESSECCSSDSVGPNKHLEQVRNETPEKHLTSQTVSCSTHQMVVKEENEETLVQKRKEVGNRDVTRETDHPEMDVIAVGDDYKGMELENEQDECQVVYEKHNVFPDLEMANHGTGTKTRPCNEITDTKTSPPAASLPSIPATLEKSPEKPVVFELASLSTSVDEMMSEGGAQGEEDNERESDQSPGNILERFLTSRQRAPADQEAERSKQKQALSTTAENDVHILGGPEIKVEENSSDLLLVTPPRQTPGVQPEHHQSIRSVLVKEESSSVLNSTQDPQGSKRMQWNLEPVGSENTDIPLIESAETRDCRVTPEFNSNQCIFYPVKEEEREVLLGTSRGRSTPEGSDNPTQAANCDAPEYQETAARSPSEPEGGEFTGRQAVSDSEWQRPSDLRDFLLQSSDEEESTEFGLSEPQLDREADILAYFNQYESSSEQQPNQTSTNLPTSAIQLQAQSVENRSREPINYFSEYFSWDSWVEIATCTNKQSNVLNPVTPKEVARFVGVHIAMGTLKFPSPRLYWEGLTKVPLVAEAVPLTRFLELSRALKLTSPSEDSTSDDGRSQQQRETCPSSLRVVPQSGDRQYESDTSDGLGTHTDPLWKVLPLLRRFNAGCRSLKRQGDYAVDQHSLPLVGANCDNRPSLCCTTLTGLDGFLIHVDLKLDLSDKEDAVEKMVPQGSTVFLCKQELSTPAMLERLLAAGVHGAGKVGGARGHIGDEFVSSDGKLMLRRSYSGFILSTAGNGQRNMASLVESFEKAQASARFSKELQDLYSIPLTASAPTCWPQAVLWYLTDAALVNSWLLYRRDHGAAPAPLTYMAFRLEVSKALIRSSSSDTQDSVPPQPPSEKTHKASGAPKPVLLEESPLPDAAIRYDGSGHWPEQLGEGEGGRCRFGDCQRMSRVLCLKCCVFLCISRNHNCFLNFHNQGSLGKE